MKYYNYSIAQEYKSKFVIPYIGIEFSGWLPFLAAIIGIIAIVIVLGFPLSFVMGDGGFFVAAGIAIVVVLFTVLYTNEVNNETGRNKLTEFFFLSVKKQKRIYDKKGNSNYIEKKRKGKVYICEEVS